MNEGWLFQQESYFASYEPSARGQFDPTLTFVQLHLVSYLTYFLELCQEFYPSFLLHPTIDLLNTVLKQISQLSTDQPHQLPNWQYDKLVYPSQSHRQMLLPS